MERSQTATKKHTTVGPSLSFPFDPLSVRVVTAGILVVMHESGFEIHPDGFSPDSSPGHGLEIYRLPIGQHVIVDIIAVPANQHLTPRQGR